MRKICCFLLSLFIVVISQAQDLKGAVVTKIIHSKALQNTGGENPDRNISIYLPPGYDQSNERYPVIYYLHSFMDTDSIRPVMKNILDVSIEKNKIRPFIMVI